MDNSKFIEKIIEHHRCRDQERVQIKFANMKKDPFAFMRGTCHLFYQDLPVESLPKSPAAWLCGDLHMQNFGSFMGANGQFYFDINDFDESALGPALFDIARLTTSILVAAESIKVEPVDAARLCHVFIKSYQEALRDGKARWVEKDTADGMIEDLLKSLKCRDRNEFVNNRIEKVNGNHLIRTDGIKALPADSAVKETIAAVIRDFAQKNRIPNLQHIIDVARRIAGSGSLGVERFIILTVSDSGPEEFYLFDLKQSRASSLVPFIQIHQPVWKNESERAVSIQGMMQAISPGLLLPVEFDSSYYTLKELQTTDDRVNIAKWNGKINRLEGVLRAMGQIVAWAQLRSSGRMGSAIADEFIDFGHDAGWVGLLMEVSHVMAQNIFSQWKAFSKADI
jgi:uncharacterized protein (DUF2252 family)